MTNVLKPYYPIWHANCLESARWLRSGQEYEDWHRARSITPKSIEERERLAQEYEARAVRYLDPDYTGA